MDRNEARRAFAEFLSTYRKKAGFSQTELADRAGMSRNGLGDLERGLRVPRKETVNILVQALGLGTEEKRRFRTLARMTKTSDVMAIEHSGSSECRPLVGRTRELEAIASFFGRRSRGLLLLEGPGGVGISRILTEGSRIARGLGWKVIDLNQSRWAGLSATSVALCLREAAAGQCGAEYPAIEDLCASPSGIELKTMLGERKPALVLELRQLLAELAGPAGSLLVLDDLQWSAEDGISLLHSLCFEASSSPLTILAGLKHSEEQAPAALKACLADLSGDGLLSIEQIGPLGEDASMLMARAIADQRGVPLNIKSRELYSMSGGLPSFIECLVGEDAGSSSASWPRISVGRTWSTMSERARHAAGLVAIAGDELLAAHLCAAMEKLDIPRTEACGAIEEALGSRLIEEGPKSFTCAPRLLRDTFLEEMGAARRSLYHRTLAEEYEAEGASGLAARIAYHFEEAELPRRAAIHIDSLGARLESEGKIDEAMRRYERTINISGIDTYDEVIYRILARLLSLKQRKREFEYIEEKTGRAIKILQSNRLIVEQLPFQLTLMQSLRVQGKYREAIERFSGFTMVAESLPSSSALVKYLCEYGYLQYCLADYSAFERILCIVETKASQNLDDRALYMLENARMRYYGIVGDYPAARAVIRDRIMPYTEAMGMEREYQTAALNLVHTLNCLGLYEEANSRLVEASARVVIPDSPQLARVRENYTLHRLLRIGAWDELEKRVLALLRESNRVAFLSEALFYGYRAAMYRRRDEDAAMLLAAAEKVGMMEEERIIPHLLRAERALLERDYASVVGDLEILDDPPWTNMAGIESMRALLHAGRALNAQSTKTYRDELAKLNATLVRTERSSSRPAIADILFYRAWLRFEREESGAEEDIETAVMLERTMGRAYQEARALGLMAMLKLRGGEIAENAFRSLGIEESWFKTRPLAASLC